MKLYIPPLLTCVYLALAFVGIYNHEMWLDEAQHILLAKNSASINELIYNVRYEGHPLLWNILLFFITHITADYIYVQVFHILITASCIYLISKYAPFSNKVKTLICFGYFMLYEYSILTRNYSLSLLFILLVVIQIGEKQRNYLYLFSLLTILFNTHLFSSIICLAFVVIVWKDFSKQSLTIKILSLIIFLSGVSFCLYNIIPPNDHFMNELNSDGLFSNSRIRKALGSIVVGVFPVADIFKSNYWNNNLIVEHMTRFSMLLGILLFTLPFYLFGHRKKSLFIFYGSSILIFLFIYLSPLHVANRHGGFFSVLLLISVWFSKTLKQDSLLPTKLDLKVDRLNQKLTHLFFGTVLIVQFLSGISFFYLDVVGDFSSSKKTGRFLNETIPEGQLIVLSPFSSGPALSLYSKHKLFYMESNNFGTFCKWNANTSSLTDSMFLNRIDSLLSGRQQVILIITSESKIKSLILENKLTQSTNRLQVTPLADFKNATIKSEWYFVYSVSKKNYLYGSSS
jgi:hypothetical protein